MTHFVGCVWEASLANLAAGSRIFKNVLSSHPDSETRTTPVTFLSLAFLTTVRPKMSFQSSRLQSRRRRFLHARQRALRVPKTCKASVVLQSPYPFLSSPLRFHVRRFLCCFPALSVFDARTRQTSFENRLPGSRAFRRREHFLHGFSRFSHFRPHPRKVTQGRTLA